MTDKQQIALLHALDEIHGAISTLNFHLKEKEDNRVINGYLYNLEFQINQLTRLFKEE